MFAADNVVSKRKVKLSDTLTWSFAASYANVFTPEFLSSLNEKLMVQVRDSQEVAPRNGSRPAWWVSFCKCPYKYGKLTSPANKFPPYLAILNELIRTVYKFDVNSINLNMYVGGSSSLGYHSDKEDIIDHKYIVSLSVGAPRKLISKTEARWQ